MHIYPLNPVASTKQYFQYFPVLTDDNKYRKQSAVSWSFNDGGTG